MRKQIRLHLTQEEMSQFKIQLLNFLATQRSACLLDSCDLPSANNSDSYSFLSGFGEVSSLTVDAGSAMDKLQNYHTDIQDWMFGVLSYDLKNELNHQLSSNNQDPNPCPLIHFFQPKTLVYSTGKELIIESFDNPKQVFEEIKDSEAGPKQGITLSESPQSVTKSEYIDAIGRIKQEIRDGNVYELNYCLSHEFEVESALNPISLFADLAQISPAPFAAAFRRGDHSIISASPERYIRKKGQKVLSQPIKGTRPRMKEADEDLKQKIELQNSLKERAENVMIVDLVRNDLAHTCKPGSVQVSELFGIYSYEQVHQMVSSIEGELNENTHWTEVLKHSFPMGSMTGAPKIAAMKLIEELENFKRGWYSGALGYVTPEGNFDFNVVIRSLVYNELTKKLTYAVGGAITYDSTAEAEWEECALKAKGIVKLLKSLSEA